MKNYPIAFALILFLNSCIETDLTPNTKFTDHNAINIAFARQSDSTLIPAEEWDYSGFELAEENKSFPVLKAQKRFVFLFFPFFSGESNFMILPLNPNRDTSTFVLKHTNGNRDTIMVSNYHPRVRFVSSKDGYKVEMDKPALNKITFQKYENNGFEDSDNILYMTLFK